VPKTQEVCTSFVPYREQEIYEQPRTNIRLESAERNAYRRLLPNLGCMIL